MAHPPSQFLECAYCGLPVPRPWSFGKQWARANDCDPDTAAQAFCCFGCRFAAAVTQARGPEAQINWMLTRLGLAIFLTMNVMVFTMALWTQDIYPTDPGSATSLTVTLRDLFRYLSLLFALPVVLILGAPLWDDAWEKVRRRQITTDLLLMVGVAASYIYSAVSVFRDSGPVYFEVGCMVLLLVALGRWLEATGKLRTTEAIESLQKLLPESVRRVAPNRSDEEIPLASVQVGDCLRVLAGERVPCDGRLVAGAAAVDEQILTGESTPQMKEPGSRVLGGTLSLDGDLVLRVLATAREGTLARLVQLLREARENKGHYQQLADRMAALFLPAVMLVALGAGVWHAHSGGLDDGLLTGLAVLLIACPCALGLATPMAVWAALGQAAHAGVLFRSGAALEGLATVRAVRFDKTGTLTTGAPAVAAFVEAEREQRSAVLASAGALVGASRHPYSIAIQQYIQENDGRRSFPGVDGVRTVPGLGLSARTTDGGEIFLGSLCLMNGEGLRACGRFAETISQALDQGLALTAIGWQGKIHGLFVFQEQLRPEARAALELLREQRLDLAVLTGDHAARGALLSRELEIGVQAGLLPEDKVAAVAEARLVRGPVAMVGDGINDAPALACSDVGIALGCGTDLSRESADVCLLGNDLLRLPWALGLSRKTRRIILENLWWALIYNLIGVLFACTGRLNPVLAALAMVLSSLLVVGNSLRLRTSPGPVPPAAPGAEPAGAPSLAAGTPGASAVPAAANGFGAVSFRQVSSDPLAVAAQRPNP
jgi:heavy metal translocating P-type ATPase